MVSVHRFAILTISIVLLAGVLSGGVALVLMRRVSNSYDDAIKTELQAKALAYGDTARAFLAAAGPDAPALVQAVVSNSRADAAAGATDAPESPEEGFSNAFLNLEVWLPDKSSPSGFRLVGDEVVNDGQEGLPNEEIVTGLLSTAAESGAAAAALDEDTQLILLAVPIVLDEETTLVALGTLSAEEEFAFFGSQHRDALRDSIALSIGIIALVAAFGGTLSLIVSRQLSKSSKELGKKSDLLETALEKERERARRDQLTGVLNHGAIIGQLWDLVDNPSDGSSFAVALVDVDGLKTVNDTYGHQTGDDVLIAVAQALSGEGRIVGRYGGDEFVVILPDAARPAGQEYRQEVLDRLTAVDVTDKDTGARVPMAVSIGLAIYPSEAAQVESLIKLADNAMYASRRQRPVDGSVLRRTSPLGSDLAAEMVGQIVPLLTSPGLLEEKLRLVSQRIAVGTGYDAVNIDIFDEEGIASRARNTFSRVADEVTETWQSYRRRVEDEPILREVRRTRRALIVDDPQNDERLTETQRGVLRAAELRSAVVTPLLWGEDMIGALSVASKRETAFNTRDLEFLMAVADQVTAIARMANLVEQLQSTSDRLLQAHSDTVLLLAAAAEAHDGTTGVHLQNVRLLTEALARDLGLSNAETADLGLAAVLHDIGKIRVPNHVLATPNGLNDEDWETMKRHTVWGQEFLTGRPGFELASDIARCHHERWDGSGYPDGLAGDAIPESAAIVSVADAFDAITHDRPYRDGRAVTEAIQEIVAGSAKQFSPRVVDSLLRLHGRNELSFPPADEHKQAAA